MTTARENCERIKGELAAAPNAPAVGETTIIKAIAELHDALSPPPPPLAGRTEQLPEVGKEVSLTVADISTLTARIEEGERGEKLATTQWQQKYRECREAIVEATRWKEQRDESRQAVKKVSEAMTPYLMELADKGKTGIFATDAVALLVKDRDKLKSDLAAANARAEVYAKALSELAAEHEDQSQAWRGSGEIDNAEYHAGRAKVARDALAAQSTPPAARGEGEADAIIKALTDNMGNPTIEQPDARPFAEVLRHLASLMDEKKWLTHMAKPSSESAKGWAKLLNAKADQIDAAVVAYRNLRRSPTLADEEIERRAKAFRSQRSDESVDEYVAAFAKSLRDGERRGA